MSILDRIKGKKTDEKPQKAAKPESASAKASADTENVLEMVQEEGSLSAKGGSASGGKENTGSAHRVLKHHHLSEKTNQFSSTGRYVFKVSRDTNKIEVKKAVEKVYDVHVTKVNMINVLGKKRRSGKVSGRTQDWKKAIVTLKSGERIAGLAEGV